MYVGSKLAQIRIFRRKFPEYFFWREKKSAWQAFLGGQEGFLEAFFGWTPGWRGFTIQKPEKVEVCKPVKKTYLKLKRDSVTRFFQ